MQSYRDFLIRAWQPADRDRAAHLIAQVLAEYGLASCGLDSELGGADWDVLHVEAAYWRVGGEFWIVEQQGQMVGTCGYYPIARGQNSVEIRKMYLVPAARGQGLGRYLLQTLEQTLVTKGFEQIWLETSSLLTAATKLYENYGYQLSTGVETSRCDRVYVKQLDLVRV